MYVFFPQRGSGLCLRNYTQHKNSDRPRKRCAGTLVLTGEGKNCANARRTLEPLLSSAVALKRCFGGFLVSKQGCKGVKLS